MSKVASVGRRVTFSSEVPAQDPRPGWMRLWAAWSLLEASHGRCLCPWQELGTRWTLKSLPTKSILRFFSFSQLCPVKFREDNESSTEGACHHSFLSQRNWWAREGWGQFATRAVLETDNRIANSWKRGFISFTLTVLGFFSVQPARISH